MKKIIVAVIAVLMLVGGGIALSLSPASAGAGGGACDPTVCKITITEVVVNGQDPMGLAMASQLASHNYYTVIHRVHSDSVPDRVVNMMTNEANAPIYKVDRLFVIGDESQVDNYTGSQAAQVLGVSGFDRLVDNEALNQLTLCQCGGVPAG